MPSFLLILSPNNLLAFCTFHTFLKFYSLSNFSRYVFPDFSYRLVLFNFYKHSLLSHIRPPQPFFNTSLPFLLSDQSISDVGQHTSPLYFSYISPIYDFLSHTVLAVSLLIATGFLLFQPIYGIQFPASASFFFHHTEYTHPYFSYIIRATLMYFGWRNMVLKITKSIPTLNCSWYYYLT